MSLTEAGGVFCWLCAGVVEVTDFPPVESGGVPPVRLTSTDRLSDVPLSDGLGVFEGSLSNFL